MLHSGLYQKKSRDSDRDAGFPTGKMTISFRQVYPEYKSLVFETDKKMNTISEEAGKKTKKKTLFLLRILVAFIVVIPVIAGVSANPLPPAERVNSPLDSPAYPATKLPPSQMEWTQATGHAQFSGRQGHSTVVFDDSLWVIAGATPQSFFFSDIWRSDDGVTWSQVTPDAAFGKRAGHRSVIFDDRIWVIGGRDGNTMRPLNDVWYSPDGITWTRATASAPFTPRWDFGITVFDGKIWVIGGSEDGPIRNDVWCSKDGVSWTQVTAHAGFSPRMEPSAVTYQGKIWITGGFDWNRVYNDVWSSDDGVSWTEVTPHAQYVPRRYQNMETAGGKLWVIGGHNGKKTINDLWHTTDGISWTQAYSSKTFPPRYAFTTAVYNDRLWVIAGTTGNDVWYSPELESASLPGMEPRSSSGAVKNQSNGILVTKTVFPVSIKQGTNTSITISVINTGPTPVYDIEIVDTRQQEFRLVEGNTEGAAQIIKPGDTITLTYTVQAKKTGSFRLNRTAVMYAAEDGNYQVVYSDYKTVRVIPSLLDPAPEEPLDIFFRDLFAGINEFDPFA